MLYWREDEADVPPSKMMKIISSWNFHWGYEQKIEQTTVILLNEGVRQTQIVDIVSPLSLLRANRKQANQSAIQERYLC